MSLASTLQADLPPAPGAKRARAPRATSRQSGQGATRPRKVSFYLSAEAVRKLGVVASMEDTDKSKILERIIAEAPALRRWVVSDRAKLAVGATPEVSSD